MVMGSVIVLPPFLSVCPYPSAVRVPLGAVSQSPAYAASFHTAFSQTPDTLEMCNRYEAKQLLHSTARRSHTPQSRNGPRSGRALCTSAVIFDAYVRVSELSGPAVVPRRRTQCSRMDVYTPW